MDISTRLEKFTDQLRTPGHRRSVILRRALALALLVAALGSALINAAHADPYVVTFAREVAPGTTLSADDLELRRLPPDMVPENALRETALAEGQLLAAAAARGEVVTTTRLVGPDLSAALLADAPPGEPFSMVPVPLAEPDIIPLMHHGAQVDVVGQGPRVVATGGKVVTTGDEGTVLVLLRQSEASAVAAASLGEPLTLVLSGAAPPPTIP
ncbi:SAF domain-containing protein [Corynebacterium sp. Marseille-P4321]|uniref:SAF domain-containing protein n=1 Tax=Corynebacterium sp. Marseille-P4321 TaxID=2736603 RepID=UPI00158AB301|nr:SAF domain-containing protein [Corynebacterium sp. Marseille-P4321]